MSVSDSTLLPAAHQLSNLVQQTSNVENLAPHTIRKITKELAELVTNPPEGIKVIPNDEDVSDIQAIVEGPGILRLKLKLMRLTGVCLLV